MRLNFCTMSENVYYFVRTKHWFLSLFFLVNFRINKSRYVFQPWLYIFLLPESLRFSVKPTCSTIIMTTKITPIIQRTLTIRRHLRKLSHFKHVTCRAKTLLFSDFMAGDILFKKLQSHKNGTFCQWYYS